MPSERRMPDGSNQGRTAAAHAGFDSGATAASVRAAYPGPKAAADAGNTPYSFHVLARPSFHVASWFIRGGWSANGVTALNLVVLLAALVAVLLGGWSPWGFVMGGVLLHVVLLLDNVDGHVARFRGETSRFGELLDALVAWLHYTLLPLCLGVALFVGLREPYLEALGGRFQPEWWLVVGVVRMFACWMTIAIGVRARLQLGGADYESRAPNRGRLVSAKLVLEIEAPLLIVAAAVGVVGLLHSTYALVYVVVLIAVVNRNLRDMATADRSDRESGDR